MMRVKWGLFQAFLCLFLGNDVQGFVSYGSKHIMAGKITTQALMQQQCPVAVTMRPRKHLLKATWFSQVDNVFSLRYRTKPAALKADLLQTIEQTRRGLSTTEVQRQIIDDLIAKLAPLNPTAGFVSGDFLSANWTLEWTTEREILFLMKQGLLGLPSGPVKQGIDVKTQSLSNTMIFGDDSVFEVTSSIMTEDNSPRVNFKFEKCKLRYRGLTVPLPPVGQGWFESVYLDEDLRVTRDVRGDVSVLTRTRTP